jgi:GNAT superfamily N-acetyltransferase
MPEVPSAVAELCEDPQSNSPPWHGTELIRSEQFDVWLGPRIYPGLSVVMRLRAGDADAGQIVDQARTTLRERGRTRAIWMIGSSATPSDLSDRLLALGLTEDIDPVLGGLVLSREPDRADDRSIEVVRADRRDQYHDFFRIQREAFGDDRSSPEGGEAFVDELFDAERDSDHVTTYLAYVDGEPVATARSTFAEHGVVLNGGSTLERARGRGVYRALVAARWDDAVARGTPFLTTLARPMSYPILKRVGFEDVCMVRVLNDEF